MGHSKPNPTLIAYAYMLALIGMVVIIILLLIGPWLAGLLS